MPLQATSGAASYDAFGGGAAAVPQYIEDVFSTWLTTGASANITVVNGIDLSGKGGMVWQKTRTSAGANTLFDTVRGVNKYLISNATNAEASASNILPTFNSDGFVIGTDNNLTTSGENGVSWTFRKQPKFFDVVTWSGNGVAGRTISHNLGSVPGCIIVKRTNGSTDWPVYHAGLGATKAMLLNLTDSVYTWNVWNDTAPTSTVFSVNDASEVNAATGTYVAYLFAHNAGGFGLTGTDNVISCGSYTGTASTDVTVNLGYEPQWVMIKRTDSSGSPAWWIGDTMRGLNMQGINRLEAWTSNAESAAYNGINPTATGFVLPTGTVLNDSASSTYIYIAIRRGPMKVPTDATTVYSTNIESSSANPQTITTGFPVDLSLQRYRATTSDWYTLDRLRGVNPTTFKFLLTNTTAAEANGSNFAFDSNTGMVDSGWWCTSGTTFWNFRRAPSFFDEVCYTGDGAATRTLAHNLTVAPELVIVRKRNSGGYWNTFFNFGSTSCSLMTLDDTAASGSTSYTGNFSKMGGAPTSSSFFVTSPVFGETNDSGTTYVTYLFATCAGVSKVGSYTGNGTTQTINCGFTGGARFVLIKRTDSTGDWYVWDSARGIVSGNDPYLLLNSTAAEVTNTDYIDTYSAGFEISSTAPSAINASGGTFIFLAVA